MSRRLNIKTVNFLIAQLQLCDQLLHFDLAISQVSRLLSESLLQFGSFSFAVCLLALQILL